MVHAAGHRERHHLIERPDYLALPELLAAGEQFDVVLVDGYHSFDYTMLDVFYADQLLKTDGILAVHESSWPAVIACLRFLEAHKPYLLVSPSPFIQIDGVVHKAIRRLRIYLAGAEQIRMFNERRRNWHGLAVYRKLGDRMAPKFDLSF